MTAKNNEKVFDRLSTLLANLMNDTKKNNRENEELIEKILSTFRVLFRSKIGMKSLFTTNV